MGAVTVAGIVVTPLKRVPTPGGDVLHALKRTDDGFRAFGEAYFSIANHGVVKAWKKHRSMTLNLVVPIGRVRFVFIADQDPTPRVEIIGESSYARLTVPPGLWFGFQGLAQPSSLVLNVADITHDPDEVDRQPIDAFDYRWDMER